MVRTQIQLTDRQAFLLKQEAQRQGVSVAELVRRGVEKVLNQGQSISIEELRQRALALSGKYHSGVTDFGVNHDYYLTEPEKKI